MGPLLPLAIRRSFAGRGMMLVMGLGVLVAAMLLAAAPIYARSMSDLGLRFLIREDVAGRPALWVQLGDAPVASPDGKAVQDAIASQIDARAGWYTRETSRGFMLGKFMVENSATSPLEQRLLGQPASVSGYESHVHVTSGRLPQKADGVLEVAMGALAAQAAGLAVGDRFTLEEQADTCVRRFNPEDPDAPPPPPCDPGAILKFGFPAVMTGIVEPNDPEDLWWVLGSRRFFEMILQPRPELPIAPMFADEEGLLAVAQTLYPGYRATVTWAVYPKSGALNNRNVDRARSDLTALRHELEGKALVSHPLVDTIDGYKTSSSFQQKPLLILLMQITAIALFYVAIVAALLVERQAAEIALLRSRGASMRQVLVMFLVQGLAVGVPVVLAAPFLAAAATSLLGLTPVFKDASGGDLLPVTVPPLAFAMAAGGVLLSLVAFVLPGGVVARKSATALRRAEARPGASFIQRYYLDLGLAAAAVLLLFELKQRGSVFTPSATGGLSSDPLLLASPALLIGAAAALILRFYPLLLRLTSALSSRRTGPVVSLGLWQVVRAPAQYTQLTLLLMMAVAIGTFAASYTATVDRSYRDRAGFEAGADLRATANATGPLPQESKVREAELRTIPGVVDATSVYRGLGQVAAAGTGGQQFQFLAVDPKAAGAMVWTRNDLARQPLKDLLEKIEVDYPAPGKALPGKPAGISLWVNGAREMSGVSLWARIRSADGQYVLVELGPVDTGGQWKQLSGSLGTRFTRAPEYPLTLASIQVSEPNGRFGVAYPPLYIDDIAVTDSDGVASVVDDFEGPLRWSAFETRDKDQDVFSAGGEQVHAGKGAGKMAFRPGSLRDSRGIYIKGQITPIPILVSTSFANSTGLRPGVGGFILTSSNALVPVLVKGQFDLFPTTRQQEGAVVIANRDLLFEWLDTASFLGRGSIGATEMWLSLTPGADLAAVKRGLAESPARLENTVSLQEALDRNDKDPLIAAGGSGILVLAFIAVMALVAAGLLASLRAAVTRRRGEFALSHAMGLSRIQLFRQLSLEYAVVFVAGTGAGAVLGLLLGRQMLSFLDVTQEGAKVEPPFILMTQWLLVAAGIALVLAVFVAALTLATRTVTRTNDAQALRME